jgi:hypothetical protein
LQPAADPTVLELVAAQLGAAAINSAAIITMRIICGSSFCTFTANRMILIGLNQFPALAFN